MNVRDAASCPRCRSWLRWDRDLATCSSCEATYTSEQGVPVLLPRRVEDDHKRQQARFFDEADAEYEIGRPHGTPRLYRWLIEEKFRRSVASLRGFLPGATVLTVCGGSGMDAELLARAGGDVVCSDLSIGAAHRTLERSRRHGVPLAAVVADVEQLPFPDHSFDLVYVHDGLHHLETPVTGLREMLRVARVGISVNEPAQALATRLAIRVGAAHEREEAGNAIARLRPESMCAEIEAAGFRIVRVERYGMYYRHQAGVVFRALSHRATLPLAKGAIRSFNRVFGRIGNKLTIQATRVS